MKYTQKSFSVPSSCQTVAPDCKHGWVARGRCVLCGESIGAACDEKNHRFADDALTCACGTTTRTRRVSHVAYQIDGLASR